jgi:hypothetical protein
MLPDRSQGGRIDRAVDLSFDRLPETSVNARCELLSASTSSAAQPAGPPMKTGAG